MQKKTPLNAKELLYTAANIQIPAAREIRPITPAPGVHAFGIAGLRVPVGPSAYSLVRLSRFTIHDSRPLLRKVSTLPAQGKQNHREPREPHIAASDRAQLVSLPFTPPGAAMGDFLVGDHVEVGGYAAIVRFVGQTHFSPGDWIGVELETPQGKNDGAVQGERYFNCPPNRGMFVRPIIPRLMERPAPPTAVKRASIIAPTPVSPRMTAPRPLSLKVWMPGGGGGQLRNTLC